MVSLIFGVLPPADVNSKKNAYSLLYFAPDVVSALDDAYIEDATPMAVVMRVWFQEFSSGTHMNSYSILTFNDTVKLELHTWYQILSKTTYVI